MSPILPGNIPVAAESLEALMKIGSPWVLRDKSQALVLVTRDPSDPYIVWASPKLRDYRAVWSAAAALGFVEPATEWGQDVDIDHVFPKRGKLARQQSEIRATVSGVGRDKPQRRSRAREGRTESRTGSNTKAGHRFRAGTAGPENPRPSRGYRVRSRLDLRRQAQALDFLPSHGSTVRVRDVPPIQEGRFQSIGSAR
jgi:hypothetical protein